MWFQDSVSTVSFNYDGTYVATGDMSGLVQVWKVATRALVWNSGYSIGDLSVSVFAIVVA